VDDWHNKGVSMPPAGKGAPPRHPRPPEGDGVVSGRKARLTLTGLAVSVIVLVIGLVVFFTVRTLRQEAQTPSPVLEGPAVTTPEDAARVVGGIGPPPGTDVVAYVESRKTALAQATGDRLAVVSLGRYMTETAAKTLATPGEVVALLAAAPGGAPATVTGDLAAWVNTQTAEARAEREEFRKLIPTVDDAGFKRFYESEVQRLDKLLAAIKPTGDLVFGIVVRAPAPVLQQLAAKPDVRLVDAAPTADPGPKPSYRGLRPEETSKANEPNTRPS